MPNLSFGGHGALRLHDRRSAGGPADRRRALRFAPTAVLCAIIFPALLLDGGSVNLSAGNARLIAGIVAIAVAWFSRNVVLTIAAGMLVLLALGR